MQTLIEAWIIRLVHISIASLFIGGVAGLAIWLLRVRDANLRHRIWTAVLLGMLAMPILASATPGIPLTHWAALSISRTAGVADPEIGAVRSRVAEKRLPDETGGRSDARLVAANSGETANSHDRVPRDSRAQAMLPRPMLDSQRPPLQGAVAHDATAQSAIQPISRWLAVVAIAYVVVAVALLADLVVGLVLLRRIVRQASEIRLELLETVSKPPGTVPILRSLRSKMETVPLGLAVLKMFRAILGLARVGRRMPRIVQSDRVQVPGTIGFVRPVILLPMEWRRWSESKLLAVLAHELAHVRRADWLLMTLVAVNRALYWFHPVAWLVRRRLADLAEQNCDDAALEADGNRARYATYLLEVATSMSGAGPNGRPARYSVAMARRSIVAERIDAILDVRRPLARRLGAARILGLMAVAIPAILFAAALRPVAADTKPAADSKSMPAAASNSKPPIAQDSGMMLGKEASSKVPAAKPGAKKWIVQEHIKGRVLSASGEPIAGAKVCVAWSDMFSRKTAPVELREDRPIAETQTDVRGNFEISFSGEHPFCGGWYIAATATGFGPVWIRDVFLHDAAAKSSVTLQLTPDKSIHGRIVDLQGVPLAGVRVWVDSVYSPESRQAMVDWIQAAKTKPLPRNEEEYWRYGSYRQMAKNAPFAGPFPVVWNNGELRHRSPAIPPDTVTDAEGRFQLSGLGSDRLALLTIESPMIAKSFVHVLTREMAPISAQPFESSGLRSRIYYGCDFKFSAEPTQPIIGTVTDADTHRPLPGAEVYVFELAANLTDQGSFLATRTDALGCYRLTGAPSGGGHSIGVDFSSDQPYFPTEKRIPKVSGFDPITCDFALHRGQWIVGKLTEQGSGAPIAGADVEYLPLRSNKFAANFRNYDPIITGHTPSDRYHTSADGTFRVLAIPGPGVLGAIDMSDHNRAIDHPYPRMTADSIPKQLVGESGFLKTYDPWTVTGYHALRVIDLPNSDQPATINLQFTRGLSRTVKLVDPQGQPVADASVLGRNFPPDLYPATASTTEVVGLRPDEVRDLVAIQPQMRIGIATKIGPGSPLTLRLSPCAVARGRVVDPEGHPVAGLRLRVGFQGSDDRNCELIDPTTGADGRFEALLPPGIDCSISLYMPPLFDFGAECRARPGIVFELGDLRNGTKLGIAKTEKMIVKPKADAASKAVQ